MFRTPPFRRAPKLLFAHPVVLGAVFGASLVLGLVVALTPQFLSSAASSALSKELSGRCDSSYSGSLRPPRSFSGFSFFPGVNEEKRVELTEASAGLANLGAPRGTIRGIPLDVTPDGTEESGFNMSLLYRTGWEDRVDLLRGQIGSGISIDEYTAENFDIDVGDQLAYSFTVQLSEDRSKTISGSFAVDSVHEDLVARRNENYWCDVADLIGLSATGDRLPPVALTSSDVFGDGILTSGDPPDDWFLRGEEYWELPVDLDGLTIQKAIAINSQFIAVGENVVLDAAAVRSDLPIVTDRVIQVHAALATSVRPLAIVVILVAFGLMAGAGAYWVERRERELRVLSALGAGPGALGIKASLEMFLPILLGVGVGAALSYPVAGLVGPGGAVDPEATKTGLLLALPTLLFAIGLVGAVAAMRSRRLLATQGASRSSRWWSVPSAVLLLVAAFLVRRSIGEQAVRFGENELVGTVDPLTILFPILLFSGVVLLVSELFLLIARTLKTPRAGNSLYLANRRITSSPGPVVVLIAGALIPIATLVYSAALTRSSDESVQTKGRVFIGSDIRAPIYDFDPLPPGLEDDSTYVRRADRVEFEGIEVDFLVVDRATFEQGAFWDAGFSDSTLGDLLGLIENGGGRLRAISANAGMDVESGILDMGRFEIPLEIVGRAETFPGARINRPILIVENGPFDDYVSGLDLANGFDGTDKFLWTKNGNVEQVEQLLNQAGIGFSFTTSLEEALDLTKFQVLIWTFDFLELYAALAGVIVVGAIMLYADTRQRQRNLSYALAVRMGLTRGEHLRAGFLEFGGVIFFGGAVGALAAFVSASSIYAALDALPNTPPPPDWVGVWDLAIVLGLLALAVGLVAAFVAQRTADNADVSELLRHG
jgi:FtsX-like permease family